MFDAAVRGLSLEGLKWNAGSSYQLDGILREDPADPAEVEAVAKHYAASLSPPAQPSYRAFCEKYGERRAQWQRSRRPAGRRSVSCAKHPGGPYDLRGACERCRDEARDREARS